MALYRGTGTGQPLLLKLRPGTPLNTYIARGMAWHAALAINHLLHCHTFILSDHGRRTWTRPAYCGHDQTIACSYRKNSCCRRRNARNCRRYHREAGTPRRADSEHQTNRRRRTRRSVRSEEGYIKAGMLFMLFLRVPPQEKTKKEVSVS